MYICIFESRLVALLVKKRKTQKKKPRKYNNQSNLGMA